MALTTLASGCASGPSTEVRRSLEPWVKLVTSRGGDPARFPDPFAVTPEMEAWAWKAAGGVPKESRLAFLKEALLDRSSWAFEYDVNQTFTAAEAFAARRGNCVSYANLFVALGRVLGLPLRSALLVRRPSSGREGDLVLVYNHVVAVRVDGPTATIYDFGNVREAAVQRPHIMDDLSVAALAANNHGVEAFRRGDFASARDELEAAVRLAPELPILYANLGLVRFRQGDHSGALSAYRTGLEASPHEPSILLNLSSLYKVEGRSAEARSALVAIDAGKASPHSLLVLGNLELSERNVKAALRYYRVAARLAPASVDPLVAIAAAELSRDRESAARKVLEKALKLEPGNAEIRALLAALPPRS